MKNETITLKTSNKYMWNPKAVAKNNLRWGVKLFHKASSWCLRTSTPEYGDKVPRGYYPCEKCFPCGSRARRASEQDSE